MPLIRSNKSNQTTNADVANPTLKRVLGKLTNVRRTSNGWQACCPCHESEGKHTPSLSVGIGERGRILMRCHAGCTFEEIVAAMDMRPADFAPGSTARPTTLKKKNKTNSLGFAKRPKRLSALKSRESDRTKSKRLSASEEDELLLGVAERAGRQLSADSSKPTPFPLDVFPKALKRFTEANSDSLPCPPDYIALGILAVVSSFIGPNRPLEVKPGWHERPVIFAATVGPTGSRKTPALEKAMAPARKRDQQLAAEYKIAMQEYERNRHAAQPSKPPVAKQHVTTDTTVEALADVLVWNPCGVLVYRDELTGLVASMNQYKGGKGADRQFWLSAWSCQDYTVNRKGKEPLRVTRPFLSIIGNIPPDMLGELADRRGREDGFIDRILFAFPDPVQVKWTDTSPDPDLEKQYVRACLKLGKLPDAVLTRMALSSSP